MKHYLAYHQHYWEDVKHPTKVIPGWGLSADYLHKQIAVGDILWVVTKGGPQAKYAVRLQPYR